MRVSHITPGHCVQFWSPKVKRDVEKLGRAQRDWGSKCTKMVMGLETLAHEERLEGLGSFSLER